MARPKKNVEEKKKKMSKKDMIEELEKRVSELESKVTDINADVDEICHDIYCSCDELDVEDAEDEAVTDDLTELEEKFVRHLEELRDFKRRVDSRPTPEIYIYHRTFYF